MLTPRDNRQQLPLYADNGGGAGGWYEPRREAVASPGAHPGGGEPGPCPVAIPRPAEDRRPVPPRLLVSLMLTAAASANVSFTKAYGWGVSDGASQFETCTTTSPGAGSAALAPGSSRAPRQSPPIARATSTSPTSTTVGSMEFSAAGVFIKAYGWGVADGASQFETCTSTCQAGIPGSGAGQLDGPASVATDRLKRRLHRRLRAGNDRIDEFSAAGAFIKAYGWGVADGMSKFETCTSTCQAGIGGSGAGQLDVPTSVATDPSGDVYVADDFNNRIDEFSAAGAFIKAYGWGVSDGASQFETCTTTCQAGIQGGGAGQLFIPWGVATDSSGDVYVADLGNERIDEFSAAGAFIEAYGSAASDAVSRSRPCTTTCETGGASGGDGAGALANPDGIATDPSGNVYVAGDDNRIDEFSAVGGTVDHLDEPVRWRSVWGEHLGAGGHGGERHGHAVAPETQGDTCAISATVAFSLPSAKQCVSKRKFTIHVRKLPGITWVSAVIKIDGKRREVRGSNT